MAGKESTLSIVLRTVDKATAGINAVNKRLDAVTKPTRDLGKALGDLGEKSGLNGVVDGFKGVGGAVEGLLAKVAVVGGAVALAVHGVLGLVDEFDDLGDKSEKLGTTVDFLAAMRFAAERSGASVDSLDNGLNAFGASMGQLRAGGGRMLKFLESVSPALVTQLKATKGNESAFRLLADAMEKITDPQKRLALAQKTVGDTALAPLLARGSKGLLELQGEFVGTAGSMEEAAAGAGEVDDALKNLKAATTGAKAAIVTGLSPALKVIVADLAEWFTAHRADIRQWAEDIGKRLPAAVDKVVDTVQGAIGVVTDIVDGIGGLKVAAVALAAVILGPLISSIVSLGVAILATPVGWILAAVAAIGFAAFELIQHWDGVKAFFINLWDAIHKKFGWIADVAAVVLLPFIAIPLEIIAHWEGIKGFFSELWDDVTGIFSRAWETIGGIVDKVSGAVDTVTGAVGRAIDFLNPFSSSDSGPPSAATRTAGIASVLPSARQSAATIKVDFANAPRGTRVAAQPQGGANVDLSIGYQFGFGL